MKRIISILIVTLFLVGSMPLAFARGPDIGVEVSVEAEADEDEAEARAEASIDDEEGRREYREERERQREARTEARVEIKEELLKNRLKFKTMQEQRFEFKESKKELADLKSRFENCRDKNSEGCEELRTKFLVKSRGHLEGNVEHLISMLEQLKVKLENSDRIENKAEIIARIDAQIEAAKKISAEFEAKEEATKEEVKGEARKVKELWKSAKVDIKISSSKVINNRIGGIIVKSEKLAARLEKAVDKLEAEGKSNAELEAKVTSFNENIAKAKVEYEAAVKLEKSAGTTDETMKEVHEHLKKAHQFLKEAHNDLKVAVRLMASLKVNLEEGDN